LLQILLLLIFWILLIFLAVPTLQNKLNELCRIHIAQQVCDVYFLIVILLYLVNVLLFLLVTATGFSKKTEDRFMKFGEWAHSML